MTFEDLIKIIVEAVTKYLFLERRKVLALCFDGENKTELMEAAQSINGRADYFSGGDIEKINGDYDVMFVDYMPLSGLAEAALGLTISPWGRLMGTMLIRGRTVFQLKKAPESGDITPAYLELLRAYWTQLHKLGVVFLNSGIGRVSGKTGEAPVLGKKDVYIKNVLSRQDLMAYVGTDRLLVGRDVLVTALAADTARAMKINIVKQK
ncbi:MAG: hypothetical protein LBD31_00225 [Treponema sp.]|jgi:hypothetical protein|nr:hypothetical protein [Treponema sp.]